MSFVTEVHDELKALIIATLPEADDDNVYASIKAARMNLPEKVKSGAIALPIWVLDAASFMPETRWGLNSNAGRLPLRIIEIRQLSQIDEQAVILGHLAELQFALRSTAHTAFTVIEDGMINASPSDDAMAPLLELGLNMNAGTLSYSPGLLCGVFE